MSFCCMGAAPFFVSMIAEINKWIENGSRYQEGVLLYDKFGSDNFLKLLFSRGEKDLTKQKLNEALLQLLSSGPDQEDQQPSPKEKVPAPIQLEPKSTAYDPPQAVANPPELLKVISRIEKNYSELRGLHPYLSILPEGEQLRELAFQIVKLGKENAELWDRRNFLAEGGVDPEQPEPEVPMMIDLNLLNRRESIRKSLSKARARLKKQKNPKPHTRKLVEQREQDLRLIDQEINEAKQKGSPDE